jgi:hypothetical protein
MTWKLWLGLRDADMGVLVEEVVVVAASEVIVRLALVTTKAKARVYETGSDVAGSESGLACRGSCLGEIACYDCSFRVLYGISQV